MLRREYIKAEEEKNKQKGTQMEERIKCTHPCKKKFCTHAGIYDPRVRTYSLRMYRECDIICSNRSFPVVAP